MPGFDPRLRKGPFSSTLRRHAIAVILLVPAMTAAAQSTAPPPVGTPSTPPAIGSRASSFTTNDGPEISEYDVKRQLEGKSFYLRGGYLENSLRFDYRGKLTQTAPQTSYTMSLIEIHKVHLTKSRLEIEGIRYGLHFQSSRPTEDPLQQSEKVRLTPKKKVLRIVILRESMSDFKRKVEKPKKQKQSGAPRAGSPAVAVATPPSQAPKALANQALENAIDNVFAASIDDRMIASLPDYWQLYFRAAASKSDYKPNEPDVLRQSAVDRKARLLTQFAPPTNEFAERAGVVGVAAYHVVVTPSGRPAEIAIARPIGVGLDEDVVASLRKASFEPALKDGKPVPVELDVLVQFLIHSQKTGSASDSGPVSAATTPAAAPLPGPYSAGQPAPKQP
jgi:TonB family protein